MVGGKWNLLVRLGSALSTARLALADRHKGDASGDEKQLTDGHAFHYDVGLAAESPRASVACH